MKNESKNYVLVDQSLKLLRLCLEQNVLLDRHVTSWIHKNYHYAASNSVRAIRSRLFKKIKKSKWAEFRKSSVFLCKQFCVSKEGIDVLRDFGFLTEAVQYRSIEPKFENHNILAIDVRFTWESMQDLAYWETERFIKASSSEIIPDARFVYHEGVLNDGVFVANEIELTQKSETRYRDIFKHYQDSKYGFVFYYVPNHKLKDLILEISKPLSNKVYVCLVDEFIKNKAETIFYSNFGSFKIGERMRLNR